MSQRISPICLIRLDENRCQQHTTTGSMWLELTLTQVNLPYEDPTARSHGGLDRGQDPHAVLVRPVVQDIAQPVHVGVRDGVRLEEVVRLETHAPPLCRECRRVLARPYLGLGLLQNRRAVLDDEIEVRV